MLSLSFAMYDMVDKTTSASVLATLTGLAGLGFGLAALGAETDTTLRPYAAVDCGLGVFGVGAALYDDHIF
jgi:hypothetical protein